MTFQEPPSKKKRPNPSDDDTDQQGHVGGDVDNDDAASDKDTGYTDDLMLHGNRQTCCNCFRHIE